MKITNKTGELAEGTLVVLPEGEVVEIRSYDKETGQYKVIYLELDGEEWVAVSEERIVNACDLIGGDI